MCVSMNAIISNEKYQMLTNANCKENYNFIVGFDHFFK